MAGHTAVGAGAQSSSLAVNRRQHCSFYHDKRAPVAMAPPTPLLQSWACAGRLHITNRLVSCQPGAIDKVSKVVYSVIVLACSPAHPEYIEHAA
eukprot:4102584-Pleurochrysis_carterae.AAC.1